jgi:protein involved in polysaccharide export with SLBB domain
MRVMRRPFGLIVGLIFAILAFWLPAGTALAQTPPASGGGVGGLMQMFQGLSPEQQQAIMNQLGSGGVLGTGTTSLNPGFAQSPGSSNRGESQQQEQAVREKQAEESMQPLVPMLKGGDWVIVEIGFTLPGRQISNQTATALQQAMAAQGGGSASGTALSPQALQTLQSLQGASGGQAAAAAARAAVSMNPAAELSTADRERLKALMDIIRTHNPYQLSPGGELLIPGFDPIPLIGLTEDQATLRLSVVPAFQNLEVRLTLLPLKKTGEEALNPFGYDIFSENPAGFAPSTNIPVPSNYVVGPGDVLDVLLYGSDSHSYQMVVGSDGRINFPQLGPIAVGSQLFSAVQAEIESRVQHQMIGVRASVTMAQARSIHVFVMGDAFLPGTYTISGLGTITSALYAAGGIDRTGSLRNIELKRNGVLVDNLDLYDLLIHGSTAKDAKLLEGDVVFVPTVGPTVAIGGQVRRPAVYELRGEDTPAQAISLAGGFTPDADASTATLTRIQPNGQRVVLPMDIAVSDGRTEGLRNGDYINVPPVRSALDSAIVLQGNVYTPGTYEYHSGMRLTDVLGSVSALKPNSDLRYVLIRRELPPDRRIQGISADLASALAHAGTSADPVLMPRDQITVFDLSSSRDQILQPILAELRAQSTAGQPEQIVSVQGEVNVPGQYPLQPAMTVADLVRAGGGLDDAAYSGKAELTRYVVGKNGTRQTEIFDIDLAAALSGNPGANMALEPYDVLSVKEVSQWTNQESVVLRGEVRFPGTYTIQPGETLKSVIERAGGLTQYAFPQGAVFTRVDLKRREQEQMDQLAERMKVELGVLALRAVATTQGNGVGNASSALMIGQSLMAQLRAEKAVGRLVINLHRIATEPADSPDDIVLRTGDELIVPKYQQEVTVIGEVQDPTSHLYNPDLSRDDYIRQSGGFTAQSDAKRIYVVRADGSVIANEGSRWFNRGSNVQMEPGDTIVVPINAEQMLPLPFWEAVTGIMYNVAIAAAAVHAL